MKTPKISKTKSYGSSATDHESPDLTFKASYEDLRRTDSRRRLRQHFTGAFPETQRMPSQESINTNDMGLRDRLARSTSSLNVGQNPTADSSSSSVDKLDANRLSTVREQNAAIDIGQAINLLQELKKTASPAELVALHKALLPTRDSVLASPTPMLPSPDEQEPVSTSSYLRHRSMLPPGLATRDGASGDLLRTPAEAEASAKLKKVKSRRKTTSGSSLAALDLADDAVNPTNPRANTPLDNEYSHMGAYQPGTLRITNGAVSPDPSASIRNASIDIGRGQEFRTREEFSTAPTTPANDVIEDFRPLQSSPQSAPCRESILTFNERRQKPRQMSSTGHAGISESRPREQSGSHTPRQSSERAISAIPVSSKRDPSRPRMERASRSRDASQTRQRSHDQSETRPPGSGDRSQTRPPLPVEKSISKQSLLVEKKSSQPSLASDTETSHHVSRCSLEPLRPNIDDGRISPIAAENLPRFAQRWSHRLSHISQDTAGDNQLPSTPGEDKSALNSLAKRLSSVPGRDGQDTNAYTQETPEVALAKLNGGSHPQSDLRAIEIGSSDTLKSPIASSRSNVNGSKIDRPWLPKQADSGYGSDASHRSMQQRLSREANNAMKLHLSIEDAHRQTRASEGDDADDEDGRSLYTFDEFLRSPSLLSPLVTPLPIESGPNKKHSSLLGLKKAKRSGSLATASPSAVSPIAGSAQASPNESKSTKSKKKLQKPMPESVRKELKAQAKKTKDEGEAKESSIVPAVPTDMASSFRRHSESYEAKGPAEQPSVSSAPTELHANVPAEVVRKDPPADASVATSPRSRSKSRGRHSRRSSTARETTSETEGASRRSWSIGRKRSKSSRRSGSLTPKQSNFDLGQISRANGSQSSSHSQESDDFMPAFTDHSSVARALGSSPYDQSTKLFRRTVAAPGAVMHEVQSPHQISTGLTRTKSGGLRGMEAGMASELARLKSRDVAIQNNEEMFDRPRMATPKSRSGSKSRSSSSPKCSEERLPEQRLKVALLALSGEGKEFSNRPHSMYAESIPPIPELPASVGTKVSRLDGLVAKRLKDSAQSTPAASAPELPFVSTTESPPVSARNSDERPGDSNMSVADAVKRAVEARRSQETKQSQEGQREEILHLGPSRKSKSKRRKTQHREQRIPDSETDAVRSGESDSPATEQSQASTPNLERDQPDWEQHARMWRQRRQSIGETLGKPVYTEEGADSYRQKAPSNSPAIVVSKHTTPFKRSDVIRRRTASAAEQAAAYQDLIGKDSEDTDVPSTDSISTFISAERSDAERRAENLPRVDSAYLTKPYQSTSSDFARDRSPGGRVRTPSGNFHPYTPADAKQAEHSRAESLAKLTGIPQQTKSTQSLDVQRRPFHQQHDTLDSLIDRYSGGLQFGFEKGVGFGGSAGTRGKAEGAHRKSARLSEGWGLDLSDVPVFLRKV